MSRKRLLPLLSLAAVALLLLPAGTAAAGGIPTITFVSPMRVAVGDDLVIRGRNFSPRRLGNTVIFRSPSGRTAFAKPRRAGRRKLVVPVPGKVGRLVSVRDGAPAPTRFRLRVLAGRLGRYTSKRLSPVVVPSAFSRSATPDG